MENTENIAQTVEKEIARLKDMADKYPIIKPVDNPHSRHWSDLPGDIRICFTKRFVRGDFYYHLSVSTPDGRIVENIILMFIMKMLNAPDEVEEVTENGNEAIRQFQWPVEMLF